MISSNPIPRSRLSLASFSGSKAKFTVPSTIFHAGLMYAFCQYNVSRDKGPSKKAIRQDMAASASRLCLIAASSHWNLRRDRAEEGTK